MIKIEDTFNSMISHNKTDRAVFAVVTGVSDSGVKIKVDGEEQARDIYYNSIATVEIGDRVMLAYVSETIIILGKLLYYKEA